MKEPHPKPPVWPQLKMKTTKMISPRTSPPLRKKRIPKKRLRNAAVVVAEVVDAEAVGKQSKRKRPMMLTTKIWTASCSKKTLKTSSASTQRRHERSADRPTTGKKTTSMLKTIPKRMKKSVQNADLAVVVVGASVVGKNPRRLRLLQTAIQTMTSKMTTTT